MPSKLAFTAVLNGHNKKPLLAAFAVAWWDTSLRTCSFAESCHVIRRLDGSYLSPAHANPPEDRSLPCVARLKKKKRRRKSIVKCQAIIRFEKIDCFLFKQTNKQTKVQWIVLENWGDFSALDLRKKVGSSAFQTSKFPVLLCEVCANGCKISQEQALISDTGFICMKLINPICT